MIKLKNPVTKKMRVFTFGRGMTLEKWMHQNHAEYLDSREGSLLDNALIATARGIAGVYEEFVNTNESRYRVEFSPDGDSGAEARWYEFCDRYDEEFNNEE